jgi:lysozyme
MKPRLKASPAALELIERFEGFRRSAARLDDGRWTVGYGHTEFARQGMEITEAEAGEFLNYDLWEVAKSLNDWVYTPLTQNQFDALAAFAFNIGLENFRRSDVLKRINEGSLLQAACAMEMWRRADFEGERIVIDALVRRRSAEKALFLTPTDGFLHAPTPVLKPQQDSTLAGAVPAERPVEVSASLQGERATAERIGPLADYRPLPPMEDERAPSASEVAADAVIDRLRAIPSEAPRAEAVQAEPAPIQAPPIFSPEPEPSPEPIQPFDSEFELTPPPAEPPHLEPEEPPVEFRASDDREEAPLFPSEPMTFDDFESQRVAHHEFDALTELDETPLEPIRGLNPVVMWLGLIVVGLIVFAAGIFWGFNAKQAPGGGLFSLHALVGWGLGIGGIGCVATAVYFLLERLGGREEQ